MGYADTILYLPVPCAVYHWYHRRAYAQERDYSFYVRGTDVERSEPVTGSVFKNAPCGCGSFNQHEPANGCGRAVICILYYGSCGGRGKCGAGDNSNVVPQYTFG